MTHADAVKLLSDTLALATEKIPIEDQAKLVGAIYNNEVPKALADLNQAANLAFHEVRMRESPADQKFAEAHQKLAKAKDYVARLAQFSLESPDEMKVLQNKMQ